MEREPVFTREMRSTHTILAPNMAPIQFALLRDVLQTEGYTVELLTNEGPQVIEKGLKHVHNDTCYPALLVIGQMIDALDSGTYDLDRTALAITQTGGGCRASNYIHLLKKALINAGYSRIPVLSLNLKGMNKNSGFSITYSMLRKGVAALVYGDTLMLLKHQCQVYEVHPGETERKVSKWMNHMKKQFMKGRGFRTKTMKRNIRAMVKDFREIEKDYTRPVVKVGIVGEIYMKYSSLGNNHLEDFLLSQSCEIMIPGIMGFLLYGIENQIIDVNLYGGSIVRKLIMTIIRNFLTRLEGIVIEEVSKVEQFTPPIPFKESVKSAGQTISLSCKMGEGWLLTGEMKDLSHAGFNNIICAQPFGCLPNHIAGKGMMKALKDEDPNINIVPIDYDPGATRVNQENRIKLMLAIANEQRIERTAQQKRRKP